MTKTNNLIKKSRHVLIYLKDSMNTMDTNPNNSFKSDESNEAIMSELKEKLQEEIQEAQSQLAWSISNATRACEQALEQAEEEMEGVIEELERIVEEMK